MVKIKNFVKKLANRPLVSILTIQLIIYILCSIMYYNLIPYLLSYPPNSINTPFQLTVNPAYYWVYYLIIVIICILLVFALTLKKLLPLRLLSKKNLTLKEKLSVRKACNDFSITLLLKYGLLLPCAIIILLLLITRTDFTLTLKIVLLAFIFLGIPNILLYILSNIILKEVLIETFDKEIFENETFSSSHVWTNIVLQIFPTIVVSIIFIFMVFISSLANEIGDYKFSAYKARINNIVPAIENMDGSLEDILAHLDTQLNDEAWFIKIDDQYFYSDNTDELSTFMKKYIDFYAKENDSRIYDSYGINKQGIVHFLNINNYQILIGIIYDTLPQNLFINLLLVVVLFLILDYIILYMTSSVVGNNIKSISDNLSRIAKTTTIKEELLPVTSTDELAMLTRAFNYVQSNSIKLLNQIRNNQDMLMEKERLASLGQLIGGISHNLKTPIMSISGAAEGLTDLIKEYDESVGDPEVTVEDHHAIASDMKEWIEKIHSYTEYMSDIITAVKGQAVALSENQSEVFTIDELLKRVNILMKHEIKNASLTLETDLKVPPSTSLHGDINSLVQVVNNLITNAIQSYNGKKNESIILETTQDKDNLIISVSDHGCGMPDDVQEKIFKSMITTKGKNGTGLGMFMSYSTIKGHFNGDITFTTEVGKGTTFNIIIPLRKS